MEKKSRRFPRHNYPKWIHNFPLSTYQSKAAAPAPEKLIAPDPGKLAEQTVRILSSKTKVQEKILQLLRLSVGLVNGVGAVFFRNENGALQSRGQVLSEQASSQSAAVFAACRENAVKAVSQSKASVGSLPGMPTVSIVSCPVTRIDDVSDSCLTVLVVFGDSPKEPFLVILQLLAVVFAEMDISVSPDGISSTISRDLPGTLVNSGNISDLRSLGNVLRQWSGCAVYAVGGSNGGGRVRLKSISDVVKVDARTDLSRLYVKVMQDVLQQGRLTAWPAMDGFESTGESLLVKELVQATGMQQGLCVVVPGVCGKSFLLVFLWSSADTVKKGQVAELYRAAPVLGLMLQSLEKSPSVAVDGKSVASPRKKWIGLAGLVVFLALFSLYPVPFRLHPDCQVVPVQINYVAPRFDGLLQKVFVEPGDRVIMGTPLAELDGRELALELRSVQADSAKALKQRDNYLVNGNVASAQIGLLEYRRLQEKAKLLRMRQEQLQLNSPVDGIVLSGDLKKAEGSPVSKGQVLFELAPLTDILIELAVADADIAHVREKRRVNVHFDAFPGRSWQGAVDHISPKSTMLDGQNVFVVSFQLDNSDNLLQPGMRGQASVESGRRSLLWIYFHKPWYALVRLFNSLL